MTMVTYTGRLQRRVIDVLTAAGRWQWTADIATTIQAGDAAKVEPGSVLRAVRSLARRGEAITGHPAGSTKDRKLAAWLPGQTPPKLSPRPGLDQVKAEVIENIRNSATPRARPQRLIVRELLRKFRPDPIERRDDGSAIRTTIRRSINALVEEGKVYTRKDTAGLFVFLAD